MTRNKDRQMNAIQDLCSYEDELTQQGQTVAELPIDDPRLTQIRKKLIADEDVVVKNSKFTKGEWRNIDALVAGCVEEGCTLSQTVRYINSSGLIGPKRISPESVKRRMQKLGLQFKNRFSVKNQRPKIQVSY